MTYDPVLESALSGSVINMFGAVEILHPYGTIRLLDGLGFLTFGGHTYVGQDDNFGGLGGAEVTADGIGDESPTLTLTLMQVNSAVAVELCKPEAQGAAVTLWVGAYNPATGLVVGDPYVWFIGEVDVPTLTGDSGVSFAISSAFERFFDDDQGARLVDAFQQTIHPGDIGLQYVTDVTQAMPWGTNATRPSVITAS